MQIKRHHGSCPKTLQWGVQVPDRCGGHKAWEASVGHISDRDG